MSFPDQGGIRNHYRREVRALLGADPGEFQFEYPPNVRLGDLAMNFCFALARQLKRPPLRIAQEVVEKIQPPAGIARAEAAGAGYINLFFDRAAVARRQYQARLAEPTEDAAAPLIVVEHTSVNPNKAAHIGHIRNACLGDTMVRLLRFLGRPVKVQNYIDDTGVQVADVAVGFRHILGMDIEAVRGIPEPFDHFCWDLYARVGDFYREDESRSELRRDALHQMERGEGELAEIGALVAERVVRRHLQTMERLGIRYELLVWESDILGNKFWERAFARLRESGAIYKAEEGKYAGCWVMDLGSSEEFASMDEPDKIIVRSDGTVTYVGKDIAYHLWKFGKLGLDFRYRLYHRYAGGLELFSTTTASPEPSADFSSPPADVIYNVIDVGQEYTQKVVKESIRTVLGDRAAAGYFHFSYEKVALTPAACRELGVELAPGEESKPFVAMSGRRGLGIKSDDLMQALTAAARTEVAKRNPDFDDDETDEAAGSIAAGALRYFMIKYTRNRVLAFDFAEALNFEGESGPYLSYAMVRADNIFNKLAARDGLAEAEVDSFLEEIDWEALNDGQAGDDLWELVCLIGRIAVVAAEAVKNMELSVFARFIYAIAQKFSGWYQKYPILHESDDNAKRLRTVFLQTFRGHYRRALALMGIEAPKRM